MKLILDYLIKRPLFLSGLVCCILSAVSFYIHMAALISAVALAVLLGFMIYLKADARIIFSSVLIFIFCLSFIGEIGDIKALEKHSDSTHKAEFVLYDITYKSDEYYIATVKIKRSDRLPKDTKLTVFYKPQNLKVGDSFIADVKLKKVAENEYKADNYSDSVYMQGNLKDIKLTENPDKLLQRVESIRNYIKTTLMEKVDYKEAATLCALIFGERDYFTNDFSDCVKSAGVSHVMVVSGMHLAILISFAVKIMEKIFYNRFLKALIIIFLVGFLSLLCGFTMSILRAGITYIIMAVGIIIDRKGTPENSLGGAVSIILMFSPFAILSISLQLSLLSTFGILVVAIPIVDKIEKSGRFNFITKAIITSCVFSLSATLLTLPVIIFRFGCVSLVSVISNLLIAPAVTYALYVAFSGLIVNLIFPFFADLILAVADILTKYINSVIIYIGNLPFASVKVPEYVGYISLFAIFFTLNALLACKNRSNMLKLEKKKEKQVKEGGEVLSGSNN